MMRHEPHLVNNPSYIAMIGDVYIKHVKDIFVIKNFKGIISKNNYVFLSLIFTETASQDHGQVTR